MRILIIDNTMDADSWGSASLRRFSRLAPGATFHTRRAPHDDLPRNSTEFDRVIVSGSRTSALEDAPWVERLHEFIRQSVSSNKPLLGVCFGHQSLVRAFGGKSSVRLAAQAEFGWTEIHLTSESALTRGFEKKFYSFSAHFEEVAALPSGFRQLARSRDCEIQACQMEGLPVFGIQFHPEKDLDGAKSVFQECRKKGAPKRLLHPSESKKLYRPELGETLFRNFLEL